MNTIERIDCEPISEKAVIIQAQQGEPEAFQVLYGRYKSYVAGQCRRLGCDPGLTEDLTQDVFVKLWKNIAVFKGQSALRTWLHRITVNVVFDHFRRQRHHSLRTEFTSPSGKSIDLDDGICGMRCSLDDHVLISQILSSLSPGDRKIVLLYTAGFKHQEIAGILRIPRATSRTRLFRVREKIRKFNVTAPLAIQHSAPPSALTAPLRQISGRPPCPDPRPSAKNSVMAKLVFLPVSYVASQAHDGDGTREFSNY